MGWPPASRSNQIRGQAAVWQARKKVILKKGGTYGWKHETHRILGHRIPAVKPALTAGAGANCCLDSADQRTRPVRIFAGRLCPPDKKGWRSGQSPPQSF